MVSDKARCRECYSYSLLAGGDLVILITILCWSRSGLWTLYDVHTKSLIEKRYSQTN